MLTQEFRVAWPLLREASVRQSQIYIYTDTYIMIYNTSTSIYQMQSIAGHHRSFALPSSKLLHGFNTSSCPLPWSLQWRPWVLIGNSHRLRFQHMFVLKKTKQPSDMLVGKVVRKNFATSAIWTSFKACNEGLLFSSGWASTQKNIKVYCGAWSLVGIKETNLKATHTVLGGLLRFCDFHTLKVVSCFPSSKTVGRSWAWVQVKTESQSEWKSQ